jgi:DNA-binding MarR family transcriptional regulator
VTALHNVPRYETIKAHAHRYPELDATAVEAFLVLMQVAGDTTAALDAHLARHDISQGRFTILMLLKRSGEGMASPSELAESAGVTRATVTGLLDGLERDQLIQRSHSTHDRRAIGVHLTEKGRRFIEEILPDHFRRISRLMQHLSEPERKQLIQLLGKVSQGLPAMINE